jgi:hypothetical protein
VEYVALVVLVLGAIAGVAAVGAGRGRTRRIAASLGVATFVLLAATLAVDVVLLRHVSSESCPDAQSAGGELQIVLGIATIVVAAAGVGAAARAAARDPIGGSVLAVTGVLAVLAAIALTLAPWFCGLR